ncbi:MAG: hypothetical protein ACT4O9_09865 [Blastocatellia bacterium]
MPFEPGDCTGPLCSYGIEPGRIGCDSGNGSCFHALFREADASKFHDEVLQKATSEIREIIDSIPPDPDGRELCLVNTKQGTLLAWVSHGTGFSPDAVTIDDDAETIAKALKLYPI